MKLEQLKYMVYLSKVGSLTAVAEHFYLSRQAISSSIRQLEEELGCKLLKRNNSEVSFTKAGEEVLVFAEQIIQQEIGLTEKLKQISMHDEKRQYQWRIDSVSAIANEAITKIINQLLKREVDTIINFNMTDIDTLFEKLKTDNCDIGILTANPFELERRIALLGKDEFQYEILGEDCFVFCVNKKYYKETSTIIQVSEMQKYRKGVYSAILDQKHIMPEDGLPSAASSLVTYSNDADFHRKMLMYESYGVLMPSLVFDKFFDNKKFMKLTIDVVPTKLHHVLIYKKRDDENMRNLVRNLKNNI